MVQHIAWPIHRLCSTQIVQHIDGAAESLAHTQIVQYTDGAEHSLYQTQIVHPINLVNISKAMWCIELQFHGRDVQYKPWQR